jgi:hypothetical protein
MRRLIAVLFIGMGILAVQAQSELAATLEVLASGVSVQRINTEAFINVTQEAIVGVGDIIKTDETGRARITFFADGTETDLLPSTEYTISEFTSDGTSFQLTVGVLVGQTTQRLGRILDANSSYNVNTAGMTLAARGTVFDIRVEPSGRSGMLVSEGVVASEQGDTTVSVEAEFGVRAEEGEGLSDVVRAASFAQLDAAIDGCAVSLKTSDDVSLNVRISPNAESQRVGTVAANDVTLAFGTLSDGKWYRIPFAGGFGWVLSSTGTVDKACAGLRIFGTDQVEDPSLYSDLETPISIETPEATAEATPGS